MKTTSNLSKTDCCDGGRVDYFWMAISAVLALALIAVLLIRSRKDESAAVADGGDAVALVPVVSAITEAQDDNESEAFVSIALLPAANAIEHARLTEISDPSILARISQSIPAVAETATRTAANNALANMEVYKAILPAGKSLAKSKTMEGAYRGFSRAGTAANSPFSSQANFVKVDLSKSTAVANGVANVMNVGSLVVGQYYMAEINGRLETLTKSVNKFGDFQDREFKSKLVSLIAHVGEISQFSSEVMEDDTQRHIKMQTLDHLRIRATDLLGQVIITIDDLMKKNPCPDYKDYEDLITDLAMLLGYRDALLVVLEEISELTYLLGRGSVSAESSHSLLKKYREQSNQVGARLGGWHDKQVGRLQIDVSKERRTKSGWDAFFAAVPSVIDERFKYRALQEGIVGEIGNQTSSVCEDWRDPDDVYEEDVEIIIKDGKLFYLHEPVNGEDGQ